MARQHFFQKCIEGGKMASLLSKLGFQKDPHHSGKGGHQSWVHTVNGATIKTCTSPALGTCKELEGQIKTILGLDGKFEFNRQSAKNLTKKLRAGEVKPPKSITQRQHGVRGQSHVSA